MKTIITNSQKIEELLIRGVEKIIEKESLLKKLKSGKKLRVKFGIDPTGPKIHLGRAVPLWKLREFQELGHQIILIIGDFTGRIGDASDKQSMRKPLSDKEIKENMKNYLPQIGKILDVKKTEIRYNSQWLNKLTAGELNRLAMKFTAQQMIQRRNFKERWERGNPIGLQELSYPLFQGYDSVAVRADVEIGGSDQLFNLKVGREIQKIFNQPLQDIITMKMLSGLDGRKMATSWGNIIAIVEEPKELYGKIMSMKDELIGDYFELGTRISLKELEEIRKELASGKVNPRDLKARLAKEIVTLYYDREKAEKEEDEFKRIFREKKTPSQIPEVFLKEKSLGIIDILTKTKLVSSKSEAKRLILQKGVKINNEIESDWRKTIKIRKGMIIRVGKRKFVKIK